MSKKRSNTHEFMLNPIMGLLPVLSILFAEDFLGLNFSLHIGMFTSIAILMWNYFRRAASYQAILLINLFLIILFQVFSSHTPLFPHMPIEKFIYKGFIILPDGLTEEKVIFHGMIIFSIVVSFLMKPFLYKYFSQNYSGSSKHMESNMREFYLVSRVLLVIMSFHPLTYLLSVLFPSIHDFYNNAWIDRAENITMLGLVVFEIYRVYTISKKLAAEEFWPIVNNSGVVIGRVARSVSLIPSQHKELHPVVRVHFINDGMLYMYKDEGHHLESHWDCTINEHVLYGETMEQAIHRIAAQRYGLRNIKPHFLLKHIVEQRLENQYILLYYISKIDNLQLLPHEKGQLKPWPMWQIEENLKKNVFSQAFEMEYDYIKNTVLLAEQFSKVLAEDDED